MKTLLVLNPRSLLLGSLLDEAVDVVVVGVVVLVVAEVVKCSSAMENVGGE